MITEDYVSFEIAKLLKEKGFDEKCWNAYIGNNWTYEPPFKNSEFSLDVEKSYFTTPTLQMAMKWLREVHKIDITVDPHEVGNNWIYEFHICQNKDYLFSRDVDTSYENCAKAAIKYCLKNLI